MRESVGGTLLTAAATVGLVVVTVYMEAAPSIFLQSMGTACAVLAWIGFTQIYAVKKQLSGVRILPPVVIVMLLAAALAGTVWSVLGKIPGEDLPSPEVGITGEFQRWYLEVENRGEGAEFFAEINFDSPFWPGLRTLYPAYWERGKGPRTVIASGLQDRLLVAEVDPGTLTVYYTNPESGTRANYGFTVFQYPEITFSITISSQPASKEGLLVQKYRLTPAGLERGAEAR